MAEITDRAKFNKLVLVSVLNHSGQKIKEFYMRRGLNLWVFLRKHGLPIGSSCSGVGVCGACSVFIQENKPNSLSPITEFEISCLSRNLKKAGMRIACLCRVYEDIEVSSDYF